MKTALVVLVVSLFGVNLLAADKPQPNLSSVTSIFVSGNNQAAERAREELQKGKTCFTLAPKADDADAVLAISTDTQSTGDVRGFGEFGQRNWIASGTLTLKAGEVAWSHSERFVDAPFQSGGKVTGKLLVSRLSRDAGCKKR